MTDPPSETSGSGLSRRDLVRAAALAGAGLALRPLVAFGQEPPAAMDALHIALIGVGTQGRLLMDNCLKIPGIRVKAVCDLWPYHRRYALRYLKAFKHEARGYADYRELLAQEKDLHGVIIATPDWLHSEHTVACLEAGLHVYCEKAMSNTVDGARQMVRTARRTGKLLQIGHQRRSNPRYLQALELVRTHGAIGQPSYVSGQWNRPQILTVGWPEGEGLDADTLARSGYDTMERFRNWRWYRKFSGGPIADLGAHQIDVFNWFLDAVPRAVVATGGADYNPNIDWYDNIHTLYEWECVWDGASQVVRGEYHTLCTTTHMGFQESFLGNEGSLIISEANGVGGIRREQLAPVADWEQPLMETMGQAQEARREAGKEAEEELAEGEIKLGHSVPAPGRYYPPIAPLEKPEHVPHLENFFAAIRGTARLNCPPEDGFRACVTVLRANEAVAAGRRLVFKPDEFEA